MSGLPSIAERVRRALQLRAREILREAWMAEGIFQEFRIGRGRRYVWNEDGMTIEISDVNRRPLARYGLSVNITLFKIKTPAVSSSPQDSSFDSHLPGLAAAKGG